MSKPRHRLRLHPKTTPSDGSYRVNAAAEFAVRRGRRIVEQGHTHIVKLSQHELVLDASSRVASGVEIEFEVPWPGCERALTLRLKGRTVQTDGGRVKVKIERYEFQTKQPKSRTAPFLRLTPDATEVLEPTEPKSGLPSV